ncbi:HAMP domain-containing sensor histidine kinase [Mesorhizobium sp. CAU 1732]|uniref:sensor histidine kinase n=1 Tax=Mesorhizobium sp. CAU 1732 TaxID=3140358 RepID=UPI0032608C91
MPTSPYRLPVTVRLPLVAAAMIFVAAVASTQTAIFFMGRQADRQVQTLGQVYLDGLSAALLPYVKNADASTIGATLQKALAFHEGVVDRRLAYIDYDALGTTEAARSDIDASGPLPADAQANATGFIRADDGTIWIWRRLVDGDTVHGTVVANLDVSAFEAERGTLRWLLLLFDLVFSGVCALLGFFMVRRVQKPVATVARHLYDAALGMVRPIGDGEIPADDRQAAQMIHAFNAMANATQERESLLAHIAEQQRQADLGRLTATIAHEVRNPLGGMRTAISTLKRFGDREEPRAEAVQFLDRGVSALQHVVDATLENYRSRPNWRPLSRQDFEDLRLLIEADGKSRDVSIIIEADIPETVSVAALEVRQILLNLLLNAVRASARGRTVRLKASLADRELMVVVEDEGTGLDHGVARVMEGRAGREDGPGLGVSVMIRLVEQLQGRVSIESAPGLGTRITLNFPLQDGMLRS